METREEVKEGTSIDAKELEGYQVSDGINVGSIEQQEKSEVVNQAPKEEKKQEQVEKNNVRTKKKRKKRKHLFLRFLLFIAIIILLLKLNDFWAEKELQSFVSRFPFTFSTETDNLGYITSDFTVLSEYEVNGKVYKVSWQSDNACITFDEFGNAKVARPETNEQVKLTQTYKKLLGKGRIEYDIVVIGTECIDRNDIAVIAVEQLKEDKYNRDMQAVLGENGELHYLMGDFKGTYIYSIEDAITVLQAYGSEFGVDTNRVEFELYNVNSTNMYTTYLFQLRMNDITLNNASAIVTTDKSTNKMIKIAIDTADIIIDNVSIGLEYDTSRHNEVIADYVLPLNPKNMEYITLSLDKCIDDKGLVYKYVVIFENDKTYELSIRDNEVIESDDLSSSFDFGPNYVYAEATGVNELNESKKFDAAIEKYTMTDSTVLHDLNRNIVALDSTGSYKALKEGLAMISEDERERNGEYRLRTFFVTVFGNYVAAPLSNDCFREVASLDGKFTLEQAEYVQAYTNMQLAYDFYYNNFGLASFDNEGTEITLLCDSQMSDTDGACWNRFYEKFYTYPTTNFKYNCSLGPEVIVHEYTHAIFGHKTLGDNTEVRGINEAYADIMGVLAYPECNWCIGANYAGTTFISSGKEHVAGSFFVARDIPNINSEITLGGTMNAERYKDAYWKAANGEEHAISMVISNIAYKMSKSGYFSDEQMRNIWYNSMCLGYDSNSTYVTNRKFVIQAAEDLGIDGFAIDFIAKCYDDAGIYDGSYVPKSDKYDSMEITSADGTVTVKTKSDAVEGDSILDDSTTKRFILVYSAPEVIFGNGTFMIYEEKVKSVKYKTEEEMETLLSAKFNSMYPGVNHNGVNLAVDYRLVNGKIFDKVYEVSKNAPKSVTDLTFNFIEKAGVELDTDSKEVIKSTLEQIMPYVFSWEVYECTSYEFYDELGIVE